jgi:hypothetical protein
VVISIGYFPRLKINFNFQDMDINRIFSKIDYPHKNLAKFDDQEKISEV